MLTPVLPASTPPPPRVRPGVLAVYTGADTAGVLNPIPCAWAIPDSDLKAVAYPAIATDVVRYVGDAVAVVVAETAIRRKTRWNSSTCNTNRCRPS